MFNSGYVSTTFVVRYDPQGLVFVTCPHLQLPPLLPQLALRNSGHTFSLRAYSPECQFSMVACSKRRDHVIIE